MMSCFSLAAAKSPQQLLPSEKKSTLLYFKYIYISDSMLKMYLHKLYFL